MVRCVPLDLFYVSWLGEMVISQHGVEPTIFWCFWIACFLICLCRVFLFLVFYCPVCFECILMNYFCVYLFHVIGYGCKFYVLRVRFDVCCVAVVFMKYVFFS